MMTIIKQTLVKIKETEDFVANMKSRKEIFKYGILHSVEFTMKDGSIIVEDNKYYDYHLQRLEQKISKTSIK